MSDRKPTVLVVDDEAINRIVLQGLIERLDVPCIIAAGGEEAINIVSSDEIDLVFLDLQMPPPDGYETARRIREIRGDTIALYAITAYKPEEVRERTTSEGFTGVVQKPLNPDLLKQILRINPGPERPDA